MRRRVLAGLLGLLLLGTAGCGHIPSGAYAGEDGNSSCAVVCNGALGKSVLLHGSAPNGQQLSITGTVSGKTGAVRLYGVDDTGCTTLFLTGTDGTFSATLRCSGNYQIVAAYAGFTGSIAVCSVTDFE